MKNISGVLIVFFLVGCGAGGTSTSSTPDGTATTSTTTTTKIPRGREGSIETKLKQTTADLTLTMVVQHPYF